MMLKEIHLVLAVAMSQFLVVDSQSQIVTFTRCKTDVLTMEFVYYNADQQPYDLFAVSRRSTCGKRAGSTIGSGTSYSLLVDLSGGLDSQSPNCGVVQSSPNVYEFTVRAVFSCEGPTVNDTDYTAQCTFTLPTSTPTVVSSSPTPITTVSSQSANYTCQAPSTIAFTYSQNSAPFDIFAVGQQTTCSRSSNQGKGSGAAGDPYVLQIDTSDPTNVCGVTRNSTDIYSVVMYVQQIRDVITSSDVSYALTCNFTSLANQVITSSNVPASSNTPVGVARQNQPTASLYVVASSSGSVLSSLAVGDSIQLTARLLDGPATGLRIRQCTASPGPGQTPVLAVLDDKGCSMGSNLVPPFIGQSPSGSEAVTGSFKAFKFTGHDTVFFQCLADFCYGVNNVACVGTHCTHTNGRRKRDVTTNDTLTSDVIAAYVMVRHDVSEDLSGAIDRRSPQCQGDIPACWTKTNTIVVASLGSVCAACGLLTFALCVKLMSRRSARAGRTEPLTILQGPADQSGGKQPVFVTSTKSQQVLGSGEGGQPN